MTRAEKIEKFIRECFEMYGLDYEEFANTSTDVRDIPEELLEIKNGLNMYAVAEAAKVLGVSTETLLNMDDAATAKWYKKYPYYIPCLSLPEEEERPIGLWGRRHLRYIKEYRKALYTSLRVSGKLNSYLTDIDRQAEAMFSQLVEQMAQRQGITEQLKASDQMAWVGKMNNIQASATEIVNAEIIYA